MKYVIGCFLAFFISFQAGAQERPDRALAIEYLTLSKMKEVTDETINSFDKNFLKNLPQKDREEVRNLMTQTMGWDVIKDEITDLVITIYTREELDAAVKFMKTPLGASALEKGTEFTKRYTEVVSKKLEGTLKKCCDSAK